MFRTARASFACLALVAVAAPAPGQDLYRVIYPKEDRDAAAALDQPSLTDFSSTVRGIIGELRDHHRVTFVFDEVALTQAAPSLDDEIVGLVLDGEADLRTVLEKLLKPRGLAFFVDDGMIHVTSRVAAANRKLVRAYDVSALLGPKATNAEELGKAVALFAEPSADGSGRSPRVVPYKTHLVVVGSPMDHARIEEALGVMADLGIE